MKSDDVPMLVIRFVAPISCSKHWKNAHVSLKVDGKLQVTFSHDIALLRRKYCNTFNTVDGRYPAPGMYKTPEIMG